MNNLLSWLIFLPFLGAFIIGVLPGGKTYLMKLVALVVTCIQLVLGLVLFFQFDGSVAPASWNEAFQFTELLPWIQLKVGTIGTLQVDYFVGVDGISMPLVVLSALLLVIGVISSWNLTKKVKGYFMLYLILSGSLIGCFVALDFFLFYVFFEFMLLPMFFLIGIWGGPRRSYASIKFFLYTLLGSLLILVVMIGLYLSTGSIDASGNQINTFSLIQMMDGNFLENSLLAPGSGFLLWGSSLRYWAFLFLLIGFLIKLPAVPFHTWLPDAHVEAPTAISVLLAGVLLKVGGYGLFRICYTIFPDIAIQLAQPVAIVGMLSIVYGGMVAMAQNDVKKLIAYSSVSHMGFVLLGLAALTSEGVTGSLFQMVSHGFISGALFLVVGVVYDRTHDRQIEGLSGLASKMPKYTFFVVLFFFASLGLPGLSGFVGEVLVLIGAIGAQHANGLFPRWIGMVSVLGIIISAGYYLWTLQRMFFGKYWTKQADWDAKMLDLTTREWLMLLPLALLTVLFGVFPSLLLDPIENTMQFFVQSLMSQGQSYLSL
ncbi:complex I subunit 4 family protein [Marinoscillum sp.]|uniref:complex I subunit 4 family protein n=1 Tax=Marinoscillum sp. TaxID=2024838 RepID=UPI003BA96F41